MTRKSVEIKITSYYDEDGENAKVQVIIDGDESRSEITVEGIKDITLDKLGELEEITMGGIW